MPSTLHLHRASPASELQLYLGWHGRRSSYQEKQIKMNRRKKKKQLQPNFQLVLEEEKFSNENKLWAGVMAQPSQLSFAIHFHTQAHARTRTHVHAQIHVIRKRNHIDYTGLTWYLKQQQDHRPLKHVHGNQTIALDLPFVALDSLYLSHSPEASLHGLHNQAS